MNGLSAANHLQAYIRWLKLGKTIKYRQDNRHDFQNRQPVGQEQID